MGTSDDIDLENLGAARADGTEMSRLIREEVRAVVREHILAPSSEPAPPSYDSADRLLATDTNGPILALPEDAETTLEDLGNLNTTQPGFIYRMPAWFRLIIGFGPMFTVFIILVVTATSDADPLSLGVVAFILVMAPYCLLFIPVLIFTIVTDQNSQETAEATEHQVPKKDTKKDQSGNQSSNAAFPVFMALHFLCTYLVNGMILWWWFVSRDGSLFQRFQLAAKFDAKIETQDALSTLTTCFYDKIPDRNMTLQDFMFCLRNMGVDPLPQ